NRSLAPQHLKTALQHGLGNRGIYLTGKERGTFLHGGQVQFTKPAVRTRGQQTKIRRDFDKDLGQQGKLGGNFAEIVEILRCIIQVRPGPQGDAGDLASMAQDPRAISRRRAAPRTDRGSAQINPAQRPDAAPKLAGAASYRLRLSAEEFSE